MIDDKLEIVVWKIDDETHPYPLRFKILRGKESWEFFGVPNCCHSRRSAMARARARVKWIEGGTISDRYV